MTGRPTLLGAAARRFAIDLLAAVDTAQRRTARAAGVGTSVLHALAATLASVGPLTSTLADVGPLAAALADIRPLAALADIGPLPLAGARTP